MINPDILRSAKERIIYPENWITGVYAVDADGRNTTALSRSACRFCAEASIRRSADEAGLDASEIPWSDLEGIAHAYIKARGQNRDFARQARKDGGISNPVVYVNDMMGHEATMELFDRLLEAS